VVREEQREGTLVYVLHTAPGADQHLFGSRGEAVAQALVSAKTHGVRAWLTDEGYDFTLLDDFRVMTTVEDVLSRLRAEFLEMPGLRLKPEQVERLCGVKREVCQMVLAALVDEELLSVSDGHYARLTTGRHAHPAKADLKIERRIKASSARADLRPDSVPRDDVRRVVGESPT
jgi:DNA-binding transcriptional regulator YdaS (Cro superfamily)